jgi:hypothetical protein
MSSSHPSRCAAALLIALGVALPAQTAADPPLAANLRDTGLFEQGSVDLIRAANEPFTPQFPLWTDGQAKRRWLYLPPGTAIDKSDPDHWEFPPGTRAWKEFSAEARIETRLIERLADGSWRFASYVWNPEGTEARLAPAEGIPKRGIPSRLDCLACHEGAPAPILGYSAVQLGGAVDARNSRERAALGYLHGNCGHCHNANALEATGLFLAQSAAAPGESAARSRASVAGRAAEILRRVRSGNPYVRMPPLGVTAADAHGLESVQRWIQNDLQPRQGDSP